MKLNFKLQQRRGGGSHLAGHCKAPSHGAAGAQGRRGPVGGACGRANDRGGFRWRHVVVRLEFCLNHRCLVVWRRRRWRLWVVNLWLNTPTVTELSLHLSCVLFILRRDFWLEFFFGSLLLDTTKSLSLSLRAPEMLLVSPRAAEERKKVGRRGEFRRRDGAERWDWNVSLPPAPTLWSMKSWLGQIYHYALPSVPAEMYKTPWI